jgi:tyrosyl-DNA phosphodiesterase 2
LISRAFLTAYSVSLGAIWRIALPSRFERDALCCDLLVNPSSRCATRIRLANVHLDSLPIHPSRRPQQLSIIASYLDVAGRGVVVGDFNPVLPEDDAIISSNRLVDAWSLLYPTDPGFTWGIDGNGPFQPNRLDKVALYNLTPQRMRVLHTCSLDSDSSRNIAGEELNS